MLMFFDLATRTGWAHDAPDGDARPVTGLITLPEGANGRHGHLFESFRTSLVSLIPRVAPRLIGYEAPIASMIYGGNTNFDTAKVLIGLADITEMVCHQLGVPYRPLGLSEIRKEFCGRGNVKKPAVLARCRELGWDVGRDDNRADAAAGWCALHRIIAAERGQLNGRAI